MLHTIRCIGYAAANRIAAAARLDLGATRKILDLLSTQGLTSQVEGESDSWGLTERGREEDAARIDLELDVSNTRIHVESAFDAFLELNPPLLQVCHDWQMHVVGGTPVLNDHSDADYDVAVIERLAKIHRSIGRLVDDLTIQLARFGTYGARLSDAFERVDRGEHAFFTDRLDSYHTVWFQLHEDLLSTLGRSREG